MINGHIFRAYDIRGKASSDNPTQVDLSPESIYVIASAIATYMRKKLAIANDIKLKAVIGRDCRISSPSLHASAIRALIDQGCEVVDIGLATSPLVYFSTCEKPYDMGLVITASHNHKDDNGIKIIAQNAHSVCGDELQEILKIALSRTFAFPQNISPSLPQVASEITDSSYIPDDELFSRYITFVQEKFSFPTLAKNLKIAVDTGNGVVGKFIPSLLRSLGIEVVELFTELDGTCPNHEANPEYAENLSELMATVKKTECDMGFGFDGDGDRIGVIDENGDYRTADEIIIVLAQHILKNNPGAGIVYDVKCSQTLEMEILKSGGRPIVERTGHSFIETRMRKEKALLAGEVSGHIFIGDNYFGYDDAMFAGVKLAYILAVAKAENKNVQFSDFLKDIPKTFMTPEIKMPCADDKKFIIVEKLKEHFQKSYKCSTIDGVKIYFSDTEWGLVRASNTSAYLTLRFEAINQERLDEIRKIVEIELNTLTKAHIT